MPWLSDTIKARNEDMEAIIALLRRVVDPREYDGGSAEAETFVESMNALLAADGFEVGLDRGRPFVRRNDASERASLKQVAAALASPELRTTVRSLHPREQQLRGITPDRDTVLMCWQPVLAVINDLHERLPGRR